MDAQGQTRTQSWIRTSRSASTCSVACQNLQ